MLIHLALSYLLILINLQPLFGQESYKFQVVQDKNKRYGFEHFFQGCPLNSECDQIMGMQLNKWGELLKMLEQSNPSYKNQVPKLEKFRSKFGIPVDFYTTQKSQLGFKPLLFNSTCKEHNPEKGEKIFIGKAFIKSISKDKAIIWRDQTQTEISIGEMVNLQPVLVYWEKEPVKFWIPRGDQPLFIKNKELYILKDEDGFFYILKISTKGDWKIVNLDMKSLSYWEDKKINVDCPSKIKKPIDSISVFSVEYCKQIYDMSLKNTVLVKMHKGCSI